MAKDKKGNGRIKNWFTGLKAEFSKIIWLNRATVIKQTAIVIVVTIIIGILITIIDFYSQLGLRQIVSDAMVQETTVAETTVANTNNQNQTPAATTAKKTASTEKSKSDKTTKASK